MKDGRIIYYIKVLQAIRYDETNSNERKPGNGNSSKFNLSKSYLNYFRFNDELNYTQTFL